MKGENGIMKKKFTSFYAEIETHKVELERIQNECRRLKDIISKMEKNIASVNREVIKILFINNAVIPLKNYLEAFFFNHFFFFKNIYIN